MTSQNDPLVIRVPETCSVQNYQKRISSLSKLTNIGVIYCGLNHNFEKFVNRENDFWQLF